MSVLRVCAVFDSALGAYGQPIFTPSAGVAVRSFSDEVNRGAPDNQLNQHPEDFALFELAVFDSDSGRFVAEGDPRCLARGKDVVRGA